MFSSTHPEGTSDQAMPVLERSELGEQAARAHDVVEWPSALTLEAGIAIDEPIDLEAEDLSSLLEGLDDEPIELTEEEMVGFDAPDADPADFEPEPSNE